MTAGSAERQSASRSRKCPTCHKSFSYPVGKGNDRKHCADKCRKAYQLAKRAERHKGLPECKVHGCSNRATRIKWGCCERCHARSLRSGSVAMTLEIRVGKRTRTSSGYIKLRTKGHAMADSSGMAFEHRLVAFEMHSGQCPNCYWCGKALPWKDCAVDHLNEVKADNRPANLVVSCLRCNRGRGAMLPFIRSLRREALPMLVAAISQQMR